jgi:hypothetical protein
MDHAEAHERIADLALEPGRLTALAASNAHEDAALLAHISGCPDCEAEIAGWKGTHAALAGALPRPGTGRGLDPDGRGSVEPIRAPAGLRDAVLAAARDDRETAAGAAATRTGAPPTVSTLASAASAGPLAATAPTRIPRRWSWGPALLGLAAVLAGVGAGGAYRAQSERLQTAQAETAALGTVTAALDRVLATDGHKVVPLERADGSAAGSISWSRQDIVVLTSALEPPPAGQEYRCWLETNGTRTPIGQMDYAGHVAFWAASLDEWATISLGADTRFGVSLEAVGGPGGSPAILDASLGT